MKLIYVLSGFFFLTISTLAVAESDAEFPKGWENWPFLQIYHLL